MRIRKYIGLAPLLGLLFVGSNAVHARRPQDRLESIHGLKCVFPVSVTGNWTNGEPQAAIKASDLSLQFTEIDTDGGTAQGAVLETPNAPRNGGFDPVHLIAQLTVGSLHLMQSGSGGPLYVTTVFDSVSRAGKLKAVHTRHEYTALLPGYTSRPEQYYGDCEIKE